MDLPSDYVDRRLNEAVLRAAALLRLEDYELADVYLAHVRMLREVIVRRESAAPSALHAEQHPPLARVISIADLEHRAAARAGTTR